MMLAAEYPFLEVVATMLIFFAWAIWFWMLITVLSDVFRRDDASGGKKVLWSVFLIVLPFVGVFSYLVANGQGMTERRVRDMRTQQSQFDDYVKSVSSGGSADEIARAKELLDSGAISQTEFDRLKAKALA